MRERVTRQTRKVEFLVVSEVHSGEHLASEIGMDPDEARRGKGRFGHQASWVVRAAGDGESDMSELIEDVLARVAPCITEIERLVRTAGDAVVLRIVQYIGDDRVGPGFYLSSPSLQLLARVEATLDVDQYLVVDTPPVELEVHPGHSISAQLEGPAR